MNGFGWLMSWMSAQRRAAWLYRRGMIKAKLRNFAAAISDYTEVIDLPTTHDPMRAMALYNRALVHHSLGSNGPAIQDLKRVLDMSAAGSAVKNEARRKLVRMERNPGGEGPRSDQRQA